jgi:hypothetical protein
MLNAALARTGLTDAAEQPLTFTPHDFRRMFITWPGESEGLKISLVGADDKFAQIDRRALSQRVDLGIPLIPVSPQPAIPSGKLVRSRHHHDKCPSSENIRPPQLGHLLLERSDLRLLLSRQSRPFPDINLSAAQSLAHRLRRPDPQPGRHRLDRCVLVAVVLADFPDHPHCPLTHLLRVRTPTCHDPIVLSI